MTFSSGLLTNYSQWLTILVVFVRTNSQILTIGLATPSPVRFNSLVHPSMSIQAKQMAVFYLHPGL